MADSDFVTEAQVNALVAALATSANAVTTSLETEGMGVIHHGATASTARPGKFRTYYWIGTVEPTNAIDGDIWLDTT